MVRSGNNLDRFDAFAQKNNKKMEKQLIQFMSMSQETLPQVIDKLIKGEKIQKVQIITPERNVTPENKSQIPHFSKSKPIDNFVKRVQLKLKPSGFGQTSSRSDSHNNNQPINQITQMREKSGLSSRGSDFSLNKSNHHFLNNSIQESIKQTRLNRFQNAGDDSFQLNNFLNQSPERINNNQLEAIGAVNEFQAEPIQAIDKVQMSDTKVQSRLNSPEKFQQLMASPQRLDANWSPSKFGTSFDQKQLQHDIKTKEAKDYFNKYQKQKLLPTQRQSPTSYRTGFAQQKMTPVRKLQVIQKNGTFLAQIQTSTNSNILRKFTTR